MSDLNIAHGRRKTKDIDICCRQENEQYSVENVGIVKESEPVERAGGRDQLTRRNHRSSLTTML